MNHHQKIFLYLIITLIVASTVLSLGIRPAKTELEFETNPTYSGEFWVVNSDQQELSAKIYTEGELGKYITPHEPELHFRSDDDAKVVHFDIEFPQTIPPGISSGIIVVEQSIGTENSSSPSSSAIGSKVIVKHKIIVQGPYPDKFIVPHLNFHQDDTTIRFVSELENKGKKDLGKVQTIFYINDKQTPQSIATEETALKTGENKVLAAVVPKENFQDGEYEVSAVTTFEDQKIEIQKKLIIGEPEIVVTYLDRYLKAGTINPLTIELLNKWNQLIENVFVDITIKKDNLQIDTFRTKSTDIPALIRTKIQEYYDARSKSPGNYIFELKLNYWNTYTQKDQIFTVEMLDQNSVKSPTLSPTGSAIGSNYSPSELNNITSFSWGFIFLILIVIFLSTYILYRYRHRDEYEGDGEI